MLAALLDQGKVVEVTPEIVLDRGVYDDMVATIVEMIRAQGPITVADGAGPVQYQPQVRPGHPGAAGPEAGHQAGGRREGAGMREQVTRVFLVRHGETEWNAGRTFQGQQDSKLTPRGLRQASELAERLAGEGVEIIYSSDLGRAANTARMVGDRLGLGVSLEPTLREIDCGLWTGLSYDEVSIRWPEDFANWRTRPHLHRMPGGESVAEVQRRGLVPGGGPAASPGDHYLPGNPQHHREDGALRPSGPAPIPALGGCAPGKLRREPGGVPRRCAGNRVGVRHRPPLRARQRRHLHSIAARRVGPRAPPTGRCR